MPAIWFDSPMDEHERRERIYAGDVFVFSPSPSTVALCDFARSLVEEAFAPLDPREAQFSLPVEQFVDIVAPLKPRFIHHPETKGLIKNVIAELGGDLSTTYLDVPRMRVVSSDGYLTAGVGHRLDAHRDTWWAAPMCQLNWWFPLYDFQSESSMEFYPQYWDNAVKNTSRDFNYYLWNATGRKDAAKHVHADTRKRPDLEEEIEYEPQFRVVLPVGGMVLFSGAQLHSTVPNTSGLTRFSIDFRTVNIDDVASGRGAPNVDSEPQGLSLRDFMRGTDLERLPEELIAPYLSEPTDDGVLVFQP